MQSAMATMMPREPPSRLLAYSASAGDTMLFNNESRVEQDPDRGPRLVMEHGLNLS